MEYIPPLLALLLCGWLLYQGLKLRAIGQERVRLNAERDGKIKELTERMNTNQWLPIEYNEDISCIKPFNASIVFCTNVATVRCEFHCDKCNAIIQFYYWTFRLLEALEHTFDIVVPYANISRDPDPNEAFGATLDFAVDINRIPEEIIYVINAYMNKNPFTLGKMIEYKINKYHWIRVSGRRK